MPQSQHRGPPPTLPPPPLWRLIVAGLAIAGFLYFLYAYQSAVDERAPPAASQSLDARSSPPLA